MTILQTKNPVRGITVITRAVGGEEQCYSWARSAPQLGTWRPPVKVTGVSVRKRWRPHTDLTLSPYHHSNKRATISDRRRKSQTMPNAILPKGNQGKPNFSGLPTSLSIPSIQFGQGSSYSSFQRVPFFFQQLYCIEENGASWLSGF